MKLLWLYILAAVASYLIGGINPAIILSNRLYRRDVRQLGSHNAGFTNFLRNFGHQHAWTVFFYDALKSALMCAVFGWLFRHFLGLYHVGAAFSALFTTLGHAYPVWYHFQGGKGVAVMAAAIWFIDWRAAVVVFVVFLPMIFLTRYMSLSVLCAAVTAPITMLVLGVENPWIIVLTTLCVLFMIWRHRENIQRLCRGTESRFSIKSHHSQ